MKRKRPIDANHLRSAVAPQATGTGKDKSLDLLISKQA